MTIKEQKVDDERGTQPGHTSINKARSLVHYKIGNRPLSFQ